MKGRITFTEFLEWVETIRREDERRTKTDFYLAQIAAEICRTRVKHPRQIRTSDFFLQRATPDERQKAQRSKEIWMNFLNIKPGKN